MNYTKELIEPNRTIIVANGQPLAFKEGEFDTEEESRKAFELTEEVLSEKLVARNEDNWLNFLVWQKQGAIKQITFGGQDGFFVPFSKMFELIHAESITRARRVINYEQHKWLPTDEKVLRRRSKEKRMKIIYSKFKGGTLNEN